MVAVFSPRTALPRALCPPPNSAQVYEPFVRVLPYRERCALHLFKQPISEEVGVLGDGWGLSGGEMPGVGISNGGGEVSGSWLRVFEVQGLVVGV